MDDPRPEKVAIVAEVQGRLDEAQAAILTEYRGMNVAQMTRLRRQLREWGGEYKVYKNTLVRFAARNLEIDLDELLTGPTAIAFVVNRKADGSPGDPVGVARTLRTYAREVPALVVKGGVMGRSTLSAEDARALADLPPREQVLAELAGLFTATAGQIAGLVDAAARDVVYAVQALIDSRGGAPDDAAASGAEPTDNAASTDAA
jgi:large subunit ribosomal protein L10